MSALGGAFSSRSDSPFNRTTGKAAGRDLIKDTEYEQTLSQMASDYYNTTAPAREGILSQAGAVLEGGISPDQLPAFSPLYATGRGSIEDQFNVARESILAGTRPGGAQTAALARLETDRAKGVAEMNNVLTARLIEDILAKLYGAAFGAPQTAMAGIGGAADAFASRYGSTESSQAARFGAHTSGLSNAGKGFK